ncbi:hypothetical protein AVEN_204979-1 [Araneus ventricosus]|uniref:Uncharacterized protein n=1 Tax=Araneus ventricosus TaxID=182803 RepID=A0A4Y2SEQ4_ARAVE|nr:hypothetical protein AVEN_204979-1 [Araneus ventricosus]
MIGNLANDLKMVKNELRLLQGDIKNFKEGRHSLLLQIQEKNKNVENSKSDNDSLVKTNEYYDKKKSGKVSLRKGDIVTVRRNPKRQVSQQKLNHDTEHPWLSQKSSLVTHTESHN